jgi:hypothetical protein
MHCAELKPSENNATFSTESATWKYIQFRMR